MNTFKSLCLAALFTICGSASYAQSTAAQAITGYLTTIGCPSGSTVCFVQYGATGSITQTVLSAAIASSGSPTTAASTAPADVFTVLGGVDASPSTLTVTDTRLTGVPTVQTAGTGCTNGSGKTLTGTTGTGTKFQVSATASGNAIVSVQSISVAGDYTVNPTDLTQEPVTGDSCSGAKLAIAMGAFKASVTTAGNYQLIPINPVAISSSGLDATSTWTLSWQVATTSSSGTSAVNIAQVNGTTTSTGTGAQGAGAQRVTVATDSATVAGSASLPAGTNNIGLVQLTPGTANGLTFTTVTAANSTNATNLKASAGNLYHISGYSAAAVPTWLTFYNNSGTPTCGSSIVWEVLIPVNSTSGGGFVEDIPEGLSFSTGIAYCMTTAIGGTGSVAATSIVANFSYK